MISVTSVILDIVITGSHRLAGGLGVHPMWQVDCSYLNVRDSSSNMANTEVNVNNRCLCWVMRHLHVAKPSGMLCAFEGGAREGKLFSVHTWLREKRLHKDQNAEKESQHTSFVHAQEVRWSVWVSRTYRVSHQRGTGKFSKRQAHFLHPAFGHFTRSERRPKFYSRQDL